MITQAKEPEIVLRNGKPVAVILDIDVYQEILEKLEATEDLEILGKMRQEKLEFRSLDDFLQEYKPDV
ncbi:MAG: type II toxin-antitoxin system Phd/YefM family antitoxin [Microcystaceae cyanobacterium]